jgi:hypothetical protein
MSSQPGRVPFAALTLDYPMSIGVFEHAIAQAQKAVDTLSDAQFPVQNCLIVGTELRQLGAGHRPAHLEPGVARRERCRACGWASSWAWSSRSSRTARTRVTLVLSTMLYGAVFGAVWGAIGYAFTRGQRDFTSVSRIVPGKYEVLAEHKVAAAGPRDPAGRRPHPGVHPMRVRMPPHRPTRRRLPAPPSATPTT